MLTIAATSQTLHLPRALVTLEFGYARNLEGRRAVLGTARGADLAFDRRGADRDGDHRGAGSADELPFGTDLHSVLFVVVLGYRGQGSFACVGV